MIHDHFSLLDKILQLTDLPENQKSQKEKFHLLKLMLIDLCKSINSKERMIDLSNHIILFLHLYKKNQSEIDLVSGSYGRTLKDNKSKKVVEILRNEFAND